MFGVRRLEFDFKNQVLQLRTFVLFKNLKFFVKFSARIPRTFTTIGRSIRQIEI